MQKIGKKLIEFMPKKNVPLDSACVFLLYTMYSNALRDFTQGLFCDNGYCTNHLPLR